MKIGIDISQLTYQQTGVANYLEGLVKALIDNDSGDEYVLFYSTLRGNLASRLEELFKNPHVTVKKFKIPPTILHFLWNKLHVLPIEVFIGDVDIFISSDWTEPPVKKAKKATILYDLIVFLYPNESTEKIIATQKRKLMWVKKESSAIFCISEATKKDAIKILGIDEGKFHVIYPGFTL
ncbi:MAG: glycosyltransferase [Candidatus Levybacteria bacterium]|nr:glycosyltransferase [Candidatus Levybacteria bacterium]